MPPYDPIEKTYIWTDEHVRKALAVMDKQSPSKSHACFAVLMTMRSDYEAELDKLRAELADMKREEANDWL